MQSIAVRVFGGLIKQRGRLFGLLLSFIIAIMGLLVMSTQNVYAVDASLIDGKFTYNGKEFTGPSTMTGNNIPQVPAGSKYYLENVASNAKERTIVFSDQDILAGGKVNVVTLEFTPPNTYGTQTGETEVVAVTDTPSTAEGGSEDVSCTAQVGSFGWVICPMSDALSRATDYLMNDILAQFLEVKALSTDTKSPTYMVWEYMRNLANVMFVICFMIVIMSQITSLGISNYGIKKLLPRIIIAAVLVNLSYMICAIGVDLSNIFGSQLYGVFESIRSSAIEAGAMTAPQVGWGELLAYITGGVAIAGLGVMAAGGFMGLVFLLLPILFGALVAVLAAIFTLAARQALIMVLVIVSPLAFVAYLLPNTDGLFTSWRKLLMQMLIIYPAFSLIFGASQLAGWAIISGATSVAMVILGLAVQVIPLVFTPILAKMSGPLLGSIGNFMKKPFAPAERAVSAWGKDQQTLRKAQQLANSSSRRPTVRMARWLDSSKRERALKTEQYGVMAKADFDQKQQDKLAIEEARSEAMRNGTSVAEAVAKVRQDIKTRDAARYTEERRLRRVRSGRQRLAGDSVTSMYERAELGRMRSADSGKYIEDYLTRQKSAYDEVEFEETLEDGTVERRTVRRARTALGRNEYASRVLTYGAENNKKQLDNFASEMGDNYRYSRGGRYDEPMKALAAQQFQNYLDDNTLTRRRALNDISDRLAYEKEVAAAKNAGVNSEEYRRFIIGATASGAGSDENVANVLANAVAIRAKDDEDNLRSYTTLFSEMRDTAEVDVEFKHALANSNKTQAAAGLKELIKRGDVDLAVAAMRSIKFEVGSDMEKYISNVGLTVKDDAAPIWAFSKGTKILTAKRASKRTALRGTGMSEEDIEATILADAELGAKSMDDMWMEGTIQKYQSEVNDYGVYKGQDRTTWQTYMDMQDYGIASNPLGVDEGTRNKAVRSVFFGGVDGEALLNNSLFIFGLRKGRDAAGNTVYLDKKKPDGSSYVGTGEIDAFMEASSPQQIAAMKSTGLELMISAYQQKNGWTRDEVRTYVQGRLATRVKQINSGPPNLRGQMNPGVAEWLGVKLDK